MTGDELEAIVDGIAPVIGLLIRQAAHAAVVEQQAAMATQIADVVHATKEISATRERVAVLETRAPVPGPPGDPGEDGVGFDDLLVEYDGERSFTFKCVRGAVVKELGTFKMPIPIYRQVWTDGRTYELGDSVTWAGSEWHCHTTTTTKPGDGSKAWTLKVKRGRDGKDGVDR